jgi:hypothetical protein
MHPEAKDAGAVDGEKEIIQPGDSETQRGCKPPRALAQQQGGNDNVAFSMRYCLHGWCFNQIVTFSCPLFLYT